MAYYGPEERKKWRRALRLLRNGTTDNQEALRKSKVCGCYQCRRIYPPAEITEWKGTTAICPYCWLTAVIPESRLPFALNEDYLIYVKYVQRNAYTFRLAK